MPASTFRFGRQSQQVFVPAFDERDDFAVGRVRIAVEEAIDHRQNDQQRIAEQIADHRCKVVVVTELNLADADRVVLVDDRNDRELEQRVQRVADVEVAFAVSEIVAVNNS